MSICASIENEINANDNYSYDNLSTSYDEIIESFEKLSLNHSTHKKKQSLLKDEKKMEE